jgi:DNA-binding NarL/FixJ family response regulator
MNLMTGPVRSDQIVIAHGDAGFRHGARLVLEESGFLVIGVGSTAQEAVRLVRQRYPSACVLDVRLPGAMGAIGAMSDAAPECAIVAMSASPSHAEVCAAIRCGASGYVGSDVDPPLLAYAIRGVMAGAAVLPAVTARWIIERKHAGGAAEVDAADDDAPGLTGRHWQVLALLERRLSTAEIAHELGVSPITVRRHRSEIRARTSMAANA